MDLSGKVALVTGSTSGIALGIARALARAGAEVLLNGFGDQALEIGAAALFLCSQAAAQIRGIALPVDGGWTAQ